MLSASHFADRAIATALSIEPADHSRTEAAIAAIYEAGGKTSPKIFLWHSSPLEALWSFAALSEDHDFLTTASMQAVRQKTATLAKLQQVRSNIQLKLGVTDWTQATDKVGEWQSAAMGVRHGHPGDVLLSKLKVARVTFLMEAAGLENYKAHMSVVDPAFAALQATERQIFGHFGDGYLAYGALNSGAAALRQWMAHTFYQNYSHLDMARDAFFCESHGLAAPPVLQACWDAAAFGGIWWPFEHAVVLAERPVSIFHAAGSSMLTYADGWSARPYETKRSAAGTGPKVKPSKLLTVELPRDPAARVAFLKAKNGELPLYDRYAGGEREKVWKELVELGGAALGEKHAADALAVAYETMERAQLNVRTLIQRLRSADYKFQSEPHTPPDSHIWKTLQKLQKATGLLPLSLRAFYHVVGSVDFMGTHPALDPKGAAFAPDPLVVYGAEDALQQFDDFEPDEGGGMQLILAPDDLHKANVSGGDPYSISVPAPVADTIVESEPNSLYFVEYLRLVFAWGGFPGWKNGDAMLPQEIEILRKDLLPI
ncbi:MAG TPA: hypothetical protein VIM00_04745 [Candidatus Acidoferrum sp.]|jgi:hypothetical protein